MYCISAVVCFANPGTKTMDRASKTQFVHAETARPLNAERLPDRPVRAVGPAGGLWGCFCICTRDGGTEHGADRQETADGENRLRHHDNINEPDT